jgi:hypothetical protein
MASEERPLLPPTRDGVAHNSIYDRFTPDEKRWILFVVSFAGLLQSKQFARIQYTTETDTYN